VRGAEEEKVSRLEEAEQRLRQLEREIFQLRRFGRDRFEVGDVIRFDKTHNAQDGTGKTYTYAAVKTSAGWSLTRRPVHTYDELIEFVVQYPAAENVQVATAWIDVTEAADEVVKFSAVDGPYPYTKTDEPEYEIRGEKTSFVSPSKSD
jgi:hypothetical protein